MIGIQKNRIVKFVADTFDQRCRLIHADEVALAFRNARHHGHTETSSSGDDRFECRKVGKIEMTDCDSVQFSVGENFAKSLHASLSPPRKFVANRLLDPYSSLR